VIFRIRRPTWLLFVAILAAACTGQVGASSSPAANSPSAAPPTATPWPTSEPATDPPASAATDWVIYDPDLDAPAAIEAALAKANVDGKHVLLDFGADWCPDCHVLDSYFRDPRAKAILEKSYNVVRIDVGFVDNNLETVRKYGNPIGVGIPSLVVLDSDGTILVDTASGELADSSRYTADDLVTFLTSWAA
jgi:thiol:disulfide interchange protein